MLYKETVTPELVSILSTLQACPEFASFRLVGGTADFKYWLTEEVVVKWTFVQISTGDGKTRRFVMDLKSSFE